MSLKQELEEALLQQARRRRPGGRPCLVRGGALPSPRPQGVEFARAQGLAAFGSGGGAGSDALIVLSGPAGRLFAGEEELAEMQFVTRLVPPPHVDGTPALTSQVRSGALAALRGCAAGALGPAARSSVASAARWPSCPPAGRGAREAARVRRWGDHCVPLHQGELRGYGGAMGGP